MRHFAHCSQECFPRRNHAFHSIYTRNATHDANDTYSNVQPVESHFPIVMLAVRSDLKMGILFSAQLIRNSYASNAPAPLIILHRVAGSFLICSSSSRSFSCFPSLSLFYNHCFISDTLKFIMVSSKLQLTHKFYCAPVSNFLLPFSSVPSF